uniref:Prephenate dehydratase n=1 Tax=uncultured Candidatus Melainabacteria bacterium TaxID=2682970 RepID=A0A650EL47_9BACT|nr:prephenate dehydratase [uncultured Candidatus Melainabacteria bacterium]
MVSFETIRNIAFLEPVNSFSDMAKDEFCQKFNLQKCFTTPLTTIKQIVDYVSQNPDTIGVLPLENTIDGTIRESLDCLMYAQNPEIKIVAELVLPIELCLLSKTTEFYSITGLITTPRLLGKCQEFIQTELPRYLNIIETGTMLDAANELRNHNLTFASIGNRKIAQNCMLNILKENINDDKNNKTKYILIGNIDTDITGRDKTTVAFKTSNTPGALLEILKIFLEHKINLSYISSCPSRTEQGKYTFIINLDGHMKDSNISNALAQIQPKTSFFKCLGSYC